MPALSLHEFITVNRIELIGRCRAKVAKRSAPKPTESEITQGIPLFLDQLVAELHHGPSKGHEIAMSAGQHGHDLLLLGFSVSQVVHDYGDVCQSVTDLAMELSAPIGTDDFRTLNRCLDDAIASAVTEHAREQDLTRDGESNELRILVTSALTAFEALRAGNVGIGGSTGTVVHRSLLSLRDLTDPSFKDKINKKTHESPVTNP